MYYLYFLEKPSPIKPLISIGPSSSASPAPPCLSGGGDAHVLHAAVPQPPARRWDHAPTRHQRAMEASYSGDRGTPAVFSWFIFLFCG